MLHSSSFKKGMRYDPFSITADEEFRIRSMKPRFWADAQSDLDRLRAGKNDFVLHIDFPHGRPIVCYSPPAHFQTTNIERRTAHQRKPKTDNEQIRNLYVR